MSLNPLYEVKRHEILDTLHDLTQDETVRSLIVGVAAVRGLGKIGIAELDTIAGMEIAMRKSFGLRKEGGERTDMESLPHPERFIDSIDYVAKKVGLIGNTEPKHKKVNAALVLGGAGLSSWDRTMYTKEMLDQQKLETSTLVWLGSSRPVDEDEHRRAGEYADSAVDEYGLLINAASRIFDVTFDSDNELIGYDDKVPAGFEQGWRINYSKTPNGEHDLFVISAPMLTDRFHSDGRRRPRSNTSDTFNMLQKIAGYDFGSRVIATTNAHFRPFQGADAVSELTRYGIDAEVIGYDPSHYGRPEKTPEEKLQETYSAYNAMLKAVA